MGNAFPQGFYWPTAVANASEIVRTCEGCQFYAHKINLPAHALQTIPVTWPFVVWGLDIVEPLWKALRGYTHLLVAIDKFSKWVEVRPIMNLRAKQVMMFFTDIIYRSLLDFPPKATHKMCCNMKYLVAIDTIATKLFRGPWAAKSRVALGYYDVVHLVVAKVFLLQCNTTL
jgi:hypothetical protein